MRAICSLPLRRQSHHIRHEQSQVGSYGPKGAGIIRTYSNATPGKDFLLDDGTFLYRLKNEAVRAQFEVNVKRQKAVHVFRKLPKIGVMDMGLYVSVTARGPFTHGPNLTTSDAKKLVEGFVNAGKGDQIEMFGPTFVRMSPNAGASSRSDC